MILRYAITDPKLYGSKPSALKESVRQTLLASSPDIICLRDKSSRRYEALAEAFLSLRPHFVQTRFFLHTDIELAIRLGADGIHLPSAMLSHTGTAVSRGLKVMVSTHTIEEAVLCEKAGAYGITYGPVFATPGKGAPKGLEKLKEITGKISLNIFALGGIVSQEQIEAVKRAGADGFASIRYFATQGK